MFEAEPIKTSDGPKVYLLSMNPDPLGDIAAADMMFAGRVVRSLSEITDEERLYHFTELTKTRLVAPFEFVNFHFLIEGVTRAFTHQMVRQRTATYVQESMRFAVKNDMPVALPPNLQDVQMPSGWEQWDEERRDRDLSPLAKMYAVWSDTENYITDGYLKLIDMGMPAEDARGLAPTNVLTRIHYQTDLHALLSHAGNRLCTQAQFEWRQVFGQIAQAIRNYPGGHMTRELSSHFAPICYATGKCEFMANVDRHCSIRSRVQANHDIGRKSHEWGFEYDQVEGDPIVAGVGPQSVIREGDEHSKPVFIGAIQAEEWLLDPTAARIR